ncbi:uncharacterized protein BCR38DRAFT_418973 [Pseudomassariella vexata]|uniref:DUF676 domain-containing protein n=1 Tax=Pseudomassariella vexata TaxID=1141098 RepID=A0A1Y2EKP8_9PEZI|nr:uncharacterized protein BCR38DRAFT_418973 [Pseudomassariella vexata]ORY72123.1 hypothetical protein BCR38DRAFT_418973 [Pseudomassariella vexata]
MSRFSSASSDVSSRSVGSSSSSTGIDVPDLCEELDIVFIHGLAGEDFPTWQPENGRHLSDLLRGRLPQYRNVIFFKYNPDIVFRRDVSEHHLENCANSLLERILKYLRRDKVVPIAIIAHDLGGIIAKEALMRARRSAKFRPIEICVQLLVFIGTPHRAGPDDYDDFDYVLWRFDLKLRKTLQRGPLTEITNGTLMDDVTKYFRHYASQYAILNIYRHEDAQPNAEDNPDPVYPGYVSYLGMSITLQ